MVLQERRYGENLESLLKKLQAEGEKLCPLIQELLQT